MNALNPRSAHRLAQELLSAPDVPVVILRLGEEVADVANYPERVVLLSGDDERAETPHVW